MADTFKPGTPGNPSSTVSRGHTPSPWFVRRGNIFAPGGHCIAQVSTEASATQADANGRLMAAAPDLLAALVYLRNCIESGREPGMAIALDAIRKAGGAA